VSVEAISWALNLAPVPADRGGQPSSACKFVLVGLANHAGPDGTGAFPSVATLVRYTGLSERTVRTCLDRLAAEGIISPCDPGIVAARIKRADRRPQDWDLDLSLVRDDLDDAALAVLEHQFPGLAARLAAAAQPGADGPSDGLQSPHPAASGSEAVDNWPGGGAAVAPRAGNGVQPARRRVQPTQERGAAVAPEPSKEPAAQAPVRQGSPAAGAGGGGGLVGEFFAALDCDWRLTAAQRARLAPAVATALTAGWTPQRLAGCTGGNITGVRTRMRCWPPGCRAPNCPRPRHDRPGRRGAANATRPPGCWASTATRHARVPAVSRPPSTAARVRYAVWPELGPVCPCHTRTAVTERESR
jgi:hypothetical protein